MINDQVYLRDDRLVLVPYLPPHVARYHAWMTHPDLLAATESEPLTLAEEYENQASWLRARDKLTFILLAPVPGLSVKQARAEYGASILPPASLEQACHAVVEGNSTTSEKRHCSAAIGDEQHTIRPLSSSLVDCVNDVVELDNTADETQQQPPLVTRYRPHVAKDLFGRTGLPAATCKTDAWLRETVYVMIGDCNLFLLPDDVEEEGCKGRTFEVEVMVAEPRFRRRGLAAAALRLVMQYAVEVLGAGRFVAKVLEDNAASLGLFGTKLHFSLLRRVPVFSEVHLVRRLATEAERAAWQAECCDGSDGKGKVMECGPYTGEVMTSMVVLDEVPPR